jgi:RNA polymerase sigma-70 factor (ECF subfamily)
VEVSRESVREGAALDDADVVRRVLAGETALFEVLLRRHDQRVYRAVRGILRDEAETEDAMQAAWIQAYLHLADLDAGAAFATWVVRIAANEALQRLRGRARLAPVPDAPEEDEVVDASAEGPEERAAAREAARLVERAADRLPASYRVVFVLRDVEGLSTAETAAALGIREDAAKVRLHRARAMLREELADLVDRAAPDAFPFLAPRCNRVVDAVMEAIARLGPGPARGA